MCFGTLLAAASFYFCFISDIYTVAINQNTDIAEIHYILAVDAHVLNENEIASEYIEDATNRINKYQGLENERNKNSAFGKLLIYFSIIVYILSLRAALNGREEIHAGEIKSDRSSREIDDPDGYNESDQLTIFKF